MGSGMTNRINLPGAHPVDSVVLVSQDMTASAGNVLGGAPLLSAKHFYGDIRLSAAHCVPLSCGNYYENYSFLKTTRTRLIFFCMCLTSSSSSIVFHIVVQVRR